MADVYPISSFTADLAEFSQQKLSSFLELPPQRENPSLSLQVPLPTFTPHSFPKILGKTPINPSNLVRPLFLTSFLLIGAVYFVSRFGLSPVPAFARNQPLKNLLPSLLLGLGCGISLIACNSEKSALAQKKNHEFKKGQNIRYLGIESYRNVEIHNWSREIQFRPEIVFFPKTQAEIKAIVKDANIKQKRISIIGKGHSWNPLMMGSDYLISTVDLNKIIKVDTTNNLVTVEAGATIAEVDKVLAQHHLNVPCNIVGTTDITFGGLMATGSHGSGRFCVPMSDLMVEVEMIKPNGEVEKFSDLSHGKELMDALRLNLGLFGVMHKITFKVEPAFNVEIVDQEIPINNLFDRLPDLLNQYQTVEILWFPLTDNVTVKSWSRTQRSSSENSWWENWKATRKREFALSFFEYRVSKKLINNPVSALKDIQKYGSYVFPERTYITDVNSAIHYVNEAVKFPIKETEIAIPFNGPKDLAHIRTAWEAITKTAYADATKGIYTLNIIAHIRFSAGSTAYMSPAYGNEWTAWLDFGSYYKTEGWEGLVNKVWQTWKQIPGVKLHWAKEMQRYKDLDLEEMYGRENFAKFRKARDKIDPTGMFANDFMRELFGLWFPND